jgi:TldD protein
VIAMPTSTRLRKIAAIALLLAGGLTGEAFAQQSDSRSNDSTYTDFPKKDWPSAAKGDAVLGAMRDELERSKTHLKLDNVAAPYYIEYRVIDVDDYSADAAFGALRTDAHTHVRFLRVVVRVGDYKQDSYYGRGEGFLTYMPLDDDLVPLRDQLWLATDQAYVAAAEALTAKQSQLKQLNVDQPVDDFAHARPVQSIGTLAKLEYDSPPWTKMLQDASSVYKTDPLIETFDANLNFEAVNQYFVNSEGTVLRNGRNLYQMIVSASTQAGDGMDLQRNNGFVVESMKELPSADVFLARATKLAASLRELRDAPVVEEEYRGPVLFSADAAATVFADLIGENILGHRPDLGKNGRTTGAFATSYKSRVLPDFFTVVEDPTISTYNGHPLLGHYEIDDEGTPAQRVPIIEKGILVNYLVSREPIRDFPVPNGHARIQVPTLVPNPRTGKPIPHTSNMIVTTSEPLAKEDLKKKLIEMCQQRDLPYCYYVDTFGPKLTPRLLYKVWTKDGHEELVRGGSFGELDVRALRSNVVAAGSDLHFDNRPTVVPHSIVAPSILFDELEVKQASVNKDKLPEYPSPAIEK